MDKIPPLVFHADWFDIIEDLPQEQQLEVYRAIMLYAFRGEKSINPLAKATTALMRKFIDQDREKYAEICKKRKDAIKRRWDKLKNSSDTNVYTSIQPNSSDTNTNTNTINQDQDQDQYQYHEKINTSNYLQTDNNNISRVRVGQSVSEIIGDQIADLRSSPIWREGICKKFHFADDVIDDLLDEFAADMLCQESEIKYPKRFFVAWLTDRRRKENDSRQSAGLGVGEFRNAKGQRTYGSSGVIVPDNAPPRPSAAHWWSDASRLWEKQI